VTVAFREARRADVPAIVAMLADDMLGAAREGSDMAPYLAAFDKMASEGVNRLYVGEAEGRVVATYQLTFVTGLSHRGARRAVVEAVRVEAGRRGQGIGAALMADAEARARAAGCRMIQLGSNRSRSDAHRFYERLGYEASHLGFKKPL
jgi:GNAT superfamily N-acetyltransferase